MDQKGQCRLLGLGVVFDGTLSWEAHVSELSRRCMGVLIGLSHARQCLPDGVLKTIVTALVISRVQYSLTVYGNGSQKNFDRLQKILNFAARVIFGRRKFDHVSDLRDLIGWMPPKFMADYHTLITARKVTKHGEPETRRTQQDSQGCPAERCKTAIAHMRLVMCYASVVYM